MIVAMNNGNISHDSLSVHVFAYSSIHNFDSKNMYMGAHDVVKRNAETGIFVTIS